MKDPKKVTKLALLDFDGTLVATPSDTTLVEGIPARQRYDDWLAENNLPPRRFQGWWGRTETLLPPIFGRWDGDTLVPPPEALNVPLADATRETQKDETVLTVLMTGRHRKMTHTYKGVTEHVSKTILDAYGLVFDEYHYGSTGQPTIAFKINAIQACMRNYPLIKEVEIWEDRHAHTSEFWNFVKYFKKLGRLESGVVHQIEVDGQNYDAMPDNA